LSTNSQVPQPIRYPNIPPRTDIIEQIVAYQNERFGFPRHRAMRSGSGGIGKNDDSRNETMESAGTAYFVSAQFRTQL
ncbi:MAG: hypothetical protein ACE5H1_02770, partial [Thermodesulfobacteriota bacterium]